MELYDYTGGVVANMLESIDTNEILKAMEAGLETGMQYNNQLNNGGGLKVESLDAVLKVLTNRKDQLVYLNEMPTQKIDNTVHQYNQLYKYGEEVGIFNTEGETPEESDSIYRRKAAITKFMGVTGQVTHPATLAKLAGGMNMYNKEVENKTLLLLTILDKRIIDADSSCVPEQFDGVFRQHMLGVNEADGGTTDGLTPEQLLDSYFGSPAVIDAQGKVLSDSLVQDAANVVTNVYNGYVDRVVSNTQVFNDYVKLFHESKRVVVGLGGSVTGATMGQSVNDIMTQFGKIDIKNDKFFDFRQPVKLNKRPTSAKAPLIPVIGAAPATAVTDIKTNFGLHAGSYGYVVTAKNRYGESAPLNLTASAALAVTASQSVDLQFTAGVGGAYPADCFVIYRTKTNAVLNNDTEYYPIFEVPANQLTNGYDGAEAGKVRDRNRIIAGTKSALVYWNDSQINEYLQFADTMKMDFAITSPSRRFAILNYGTPVLYQPAKIVRIVNIGQIGL